MGKVSIMVESGSAGLPATKITAMGDRTGTLVCRKCMKAFNKEVVGLKTKAGVAVNLDSTIDDLLTLSGGTLVAVYEGEDAGGGGGGAPPPAPPSGGGDDPAPAAAPPAGEAPPAPSPVRVTITFRQNRQPFSLEVDAQSDTTASILWQEAAAAW